MVGTPIIKFKDYSARSNYRSNHAICPKTCEIAVGSCSSVAEQLARKTSSPKLDSWQIHLSFLLFRHFKGLWT